MIVNVNSYEALAESYHVAKSEFKEKKNHRISELLVKFKENVSTSEKTKINQKHGSSLLNDFKPLQIQNVKLKKGVTVEEAIQFYSKEPEVAYVEPNCGASIIAGKQVVFPMRISMHPRLGTSRPAAIAS
jgi:hypothetical protein